MKYVLLFYLMKNSARNKHQESLCFAWERRYPRRFYHNNIYRNQRNPQEKTDAGYLFDKIGGQNGNEEDVRNLICIAGHT